MGEKCRSLLGVRVESREKKRKKRRRLALNTWVQVQYLEGLHSRTEAAARHHVNTGIQDMM